MQQENTSILLILAVLIGMIVFYRKIIPIIIKPNLEKQYRQFQKLGFRLNNTFALTDLQNWDNEDVNFKKPPYRLLYVILGSKTANDYKPYSNDCLTIDMESIDDTGCYSEILNDISRITKGEMKFEELTDFVDIENEAVNISFVLNGKEYVWDLKYNFDWIDPNFFILLQSLTDDINSERKFHILPEGQNVVLGYNTIYDFHLIKEKTKLKLTWI